MTQIQLSIPVKNYIEQVESKLVRLTQQLDEAEELKQTVFVQLNEYQELFQTAIQAHFDRPLIKQFIQSVNDMKISKIESFIEDWFERQSKSTLALMDMIHYGDIHYGDRNRSTFQYVMDDFNNTIQTAMNGNYDYYRYSQYNSFVKFNKFHNYMVDDTVDTHFTKLKELDNENEQLCKEIKDLKQQINENSATLAKLKEFGLAPATKITVTI